MLRPQQVKAQVKKGISTVIPADALESLALDMLVIGKGESIRLCTGEYETAIVPLSGDLSITVEGESYGLSRKDVFSEPGSAVCLPRDTEATVTASADSQAALCKARTSEKGNVLFIPSDGVREKTVGRDAWERKVVDIISPEEPATRIVLGETFNKQGGWSSFPPHKHDTVIPGKEARMEEIYLFRLNPSEGFGTQTIYGEQGTYSFKIEDYDAVTIPWGYHPVSAMPGYELYYLWFLAGEGRALLPNTDPRYKWLEGK